MPYDQSGAPRPVSPLHSADDVPRLMARAMRAVARAEELVTPLATVERDALRTGFVALVRRYAQDLRDAGECQATVVAHLHEDLSGPLSPGDLAEIRSALIQEAERCVAETFTSR